MSADLEETMAGLMRAALAGDEAAYAAFLRQGADAVRRVARRKLGSAAADTEEDIVQETLLAIHLKRHTWRASERAVPSLRCTSAMSCMSARSSAVSARRCWVRCATHSLPISPLLSWWGDTAAWP